MSKPMLGIIGAGGFGREAARYAAEINAKRDAWRELVFIDDHVEKGTVVSGIKVIGTIGEAAALQAKLEVVCAIGNPRVKADAVQRALASGLTFTNLVHPAAYGAENVAMGVGNIIAPTAVLTTDVVLGSHVAINPQCGIGHDAVIGDYCSLYWNVNLSGAVQLGQGIELGTKSVIIQGLKVGDWAIIGAGAVVTADLPGDCTAVGVPAKVIKRHK